VRVRVLKISTRVGLEYTAGLEYYITVNKNSGEEKKPEKEK